MAREPISNEFWEWEHILTTIGALTAGTAIVDDLKQASTREQGWRGSKMRHNLVWGGKTINEGPLLWGLCWNLTAAEVSAALDGAPTIDIEEDMVNILRNIQVVGIIPKRSTQSGELAGTIRYNDGQSFKTAKIISWDLPEGTTLRIWYAVPLNGVALTTGMIAEATLGMRGGWLSD